MEKANINVEIKKKTHTQLKVDAAEKHMTLKEYINSILDEHV